MKNFFYLQHNDRKAILLLLLIFCIIVTLIFVVGKTPYAASSAADEGYSSNASTHSSHGSQQQATDNKPIYYKVDDVPYELFRFDPNTADSTTLLRLGLQPWQVRSIYRYRAKGGIYRHADDFARLYGLSKKQFETLRPYIIIGEDYRPASDYYGKNTESHLAPSITKGTEDKGTNGEEKPIYSYPQKIKAGEHININTADTTELKRIPGIGSVYARRIVKRREQLGGFVAISQLKEIEGFPDEAIAYTQVKEGAVIRKLNINKLSFDQLRKHPYLNYYQAREICDYRRLKGPIKSLNALSLLKDFPPAEIERLTPYICFE